MARKIFKTGNSTPLDAPLPGVTDEFARQVADFYEEIAVS